MKSKEALKKIQDNLVAAHSIHFCDYHRDSPDLKTYVRVTYNISEIEKDLNELEIIKDHAKKYGANDLDEIMRLIHNGWVYENKGADKDGSRTTD